MMRLPAALSWLLLLPVVGLEVLGVGCSSDDPTSPNAAATAAGSGGGARATGSGGSSAFNWMSGSAGAATTSTGTGGTNSIGSGGQNTSTGGSGTGGSMGTPGACTAIFCEDFESGTLDEALWTQHSDHGSIAVQSDKVSHGQKAAHFHMNAGKSNAYISEKKTYPELDREAFGRMYFRLEPKGPPSHTVFVSGGAMDNTAHLELANYDGGWQFTFWSPNKGENVGGGEKYPVNEWACVEWHFDDNQGKIEVWVNGKASGSMTHDGGNWTAGFKEIAFGLFLFDTVNQATDLYLDDIALDKKRVGCLPQ